MNLRQVFVDTETTGLSARGGHRVIELAAVEAVNGRLTGNKFHTYIDPQRAVDEGARRVHGISDAFLRGKPTFDQVAKRFVSFIEDAECLVHNAPFDGAFINAELRRVGYPSGWDGLVTVTCTLQLARRRFPGQATSLDALIQRAGIQVTRGQHSALEDATLLAQVYFALLSPR